MIFDAERFCCPFFVFHVDIYLQKRFEVQTQLKNNNALPGGQKFKTALALLGYLGS